MEEVKNFHALFTSYKQEEIRIIIDRENRSIQLMDKEGNFIHYFKVPVELRLKTIQAKYRDKKTIDFFAKERSKESLIRELTFE